jgi:DNA polymerase-4/DNA polymerase V
MGFLKKGFSRLYRPDTLYRQTGVVLAGLAPDDGRQYTLFDDALKIEKMTKVYEAIDDLSDKFGKHTVQHGSSLPTKQQAQHEGDRGDIPVRKSEAFKGENKRQRLGLPMLHIRV